MSCELLAAVFPVVLIKPKSQSMEPGLYNALLHAHSIGRWIVLLLLVFAILNSLIAGNRPFIHTDARLGLLLTIFADLMLLIGAVLWYFSARGFQALKANGGISGLDPAV